MKSNEALERLIKERIKKEGPVTFETFMDMALYWPGLGYYMSDRPPFGPEGDFYTSSHLHPIFGWMIALQIDEMRALMGKPADFTVVEIGPGRGYLSEGVIEYIKKYLKWAEGWRYVIIERNPHAVESQKRILSQHTDVLRWSDNLSEIEGFSGCVIANEVLDAFPVHLIEADGDRFKEIYVNASEEGFFEIAGQLSSLELQEYIERYRVPVKPGYRTEVNLRIKGYLLEINQCMEEGFVLTIDYGWPASQYYSEEHSKGTLLCYYRHTLSEDPYSRVGQQDITAHVNFTCLRDVADEMGIQTLGYCPQGTFLVSLGIDRVMAEQLQYNPDFQKDIPKIKGLLLGMGETHKVMIQYKGDREINSLRGFQLRNRLNLLDLW